ncbi:MAG: hypothetical protein IKM59_07480, partial [Oscillospiraceae bacterium]|nr:hypothetical protein [Oscillospiraceae bacterium]
MDQSTYHISLDVFEGASQGMLQCKAGDTARAISFSLRQGSSPYPTEGVQRAVLTARKADGNILMDQCTLTEGTVYYPFHSQLTCVAGEVLCELRLYGQEGELLTCPRFSILVLPPIVSDEEIVESSPEFPFLTQLLEETRAIKDAWETLLEEGLPEGGRDFDSGFVDQGGLLHLTLEGEPIEGFTPFPVGNGREPPDDLILEADRLYLSQKGSPMGQGIPLPQGTGEGADDLYIEENRLYLSKDGEPLGEGVELPKGGGGSDSSTGSVLKLLNRNPNTAFSVMDTAKEALILYSWSSVDAEDGSPTGKGSASWFVGDKRVATQSVDQGDGSFDILPYLETGVENTVKLTLEDAYGTIRSRTWTVTVISFGLTWDLDLMESHKSETLYLRLVPTGMGEKTLHVTLDGKEHHTETVQSSGRSITVEIPALSHGAHRLSAWLELVAEGETVSTEPLEHVGIWVEEGNSSPVVALFRETLSVPQYTTAQLLYLVYDPLTETALITREEKGVSLGTLTVGRGIQSWAYRATEQGTTILSIAVALTEVRASAELIVTDLGYDIAPVSAGLVLDCDPAGHSNTESNRHQFGYTDEEGNNHPFLFSEYFDWENGGFRTDPEGVPALLIKRGSTVTLDRSFFDSDASSKGKCIKLILKASNCRDYNASFLSCLSAGVGLELRAQKGRLSSESQAIDFPYCEEEKLEIDLNIHSAGEKHLASVWLHGIPSATFVYSSTDSWAQGSPVPVVIGSGDCDVWLYRMKMYRNSLTRYDILSNYIADAGTTALMMDRYERNDIYAADGTISISKLVNANPDLRVLHIKAPKMTTGKEDQVTCAVELSHKNGKGFTATGVKMKAQGTSSLEYGLAALNLDLDFSKAVWTDQKGETITAFAMRENSIPVDYFNIKLNVASSENANNVCLAEEYNAFQPHRVPARVADPRVRDTVEGTPCAVFLTNTSHSAIAVGARTLGPGETFLYGCGDMNNSKKNFAVFGQDGTDPLQCCVEIKNNNNDPCRFKSDDLSRETWDGEEGTSDFEFRYPKSPTQAMKEAVQRVLSWVVSTDPAQATGQALPRPVQYGGITYNRDNADYRRAKFKGELADHFSVDSLLYHYLFTEFHLMVDNRAKNTFLSYEYDEAAGGHRWNFCKDYDNDTAAGTDNAGGLTFRYGLEDTDSIGAQKVFNASDSVLWCNLRDTMGKELQDMFQELETAGLFDVDRILQVFKAYQSPRPEALVGEDMWAKYFMPYLNKGEKRYLEMAQGTKEDQRAGFYRYQRPYISSKYQSAYARSDSLSLRANGVSDFTVTPYSDVYVHVKFGEAHSVKLRGKQGEVIPIICEADTANDLETYLYSAGSISRLGSLAGLMASEIELNSAVKLRNL